MNRSDYIRLNEYKEFLNPESSFVRINTKQFKEIEDLWTSITGVKETFNHSCAKCCLNFLHKIGLALRDFEKQVEQELEPKPVTDSVSETKNNKPIKKATNKDTNGRKNKANNTKKA